MRVNWHVKQPINMFYCNGSIREILECEWDNFDVCPFIDWDTVQKAHFNSTLRDGTLIPQIATKIKSSSYRKQCLHNKPV